MLIDTKERARRRALVHRHMAAENANDLDAIMDTFSPTTTGEVNGVLLPTFESVRALHVLGGFSAAHPGALRGLQVVPESEFFTRDEIIIEGWLVGHHEREFLGLAPTNRFVRLRYAAIYLFDAEDKLADERITMDWGPVAGQQS